jgi:hypothetical protein
MTGTTRTLNASPISSRTRHTHSNHWNIYWTEYVIRHTGAHNLRSVVLDLAWYQYFLLDVIAVLALAVGSVVLIVFMILRLVLRTVWGVKNN